MGDAYDGFNETMKNGKVGKQNILILSKEKGQRSSNNVLTQ